MFAKKTYYYYELLVLFCFWGGTFKYTCSIFEADVSLTSEEESKALSSVYASTGIIFVINQPKIILNLKVRHLVL